MSKKCFKCGEIKSLSAYYKHPAMSDGHLGKCKECAKVDSNKHRQENLESVQEYDRSRGMLPHRVAARELYSQTEAYRDSQNKASIKWDKQNPVKKDAICRVNNAIRDGRLEKYPCEICGDDKVHGHHDDYAKPLDVRWLCPTHHVEWHRNNGEGLNG